MSARLAGILLLAALACGAPPEADAPRGALPTSARAEPPPIEIGPAPAPEEGAPRPPSGEAPRLDVFLARLLVRLAAEGDFPGAARHVAAILARDPHPDALRAACILLGRPVPPALHRLDLDAPAVALLSAALLRPPSGSTPELSLLFARLLAVDPRDRSDLLRLLRRTEDPPDYLLLALGRCGNAGDVVDLAPYAATGPPSMRFAASAAAAALGHSRSAEFLRRALESGRPEVRREVAGYLALVGASGAAVELLLGAAAVPDPETSFPALVALAEGGDDAARDELVGRVRASEGARLRPEVVRVLARRPRSEEGEVFGSVLLASREVETSVEATLALARLGGPSVQLLVRAGIRTAPLPETCLGARWLAGALGVPTTVAELLGRLARASGRPERVAAGFALGEVGGAEATEALVRSLGPEDPASAAAILGAAAAFADEFAARPVR